MRKREREKVEDRVGGREKERLRGERVDEEKEIYRK